jgi:hypothetical protein
LTPDERARLEADDARKHHRSILLCAAMMAAGLLVSLNVTSDAAHVVAAGILVLGAGWSAVLHRRVQRSDGFWQPGPNGGILSP